MEEYEERAIRAYYRRAQKSCGPQGSVNAPSRTTDSFEENGKFYVILSNVNGLLAIYQVKNDGSVQYVKDKHIWKEVEGDANETGKNKKV